MDKQSRRDSTSSLDLLVIGAFLLLVVMFVVEMAWLMNGLDCSSSSPLVASEDAGQLQVAHFVDRVIQRRTIIETDRGSFLVCGTFPAIKNHALVLERRQDGNRMLCDPAEKICSRLVR